MHPIFLAAVLAASPAPTSSPPPEIVHTISYPVCSALQTKVRPAVAMMAQNDQTIVKGDSLFKHYVQTQLETDPQADQDLTVVRLENLVNPLVSNILSAQKMLDDPSVFPTVAHSDDDKRLIDLKQKMLVTLAAQEASLDIINGFVQTQNLAGMQHEGFGYISQITGSGMTNDKPDANAPVGPASTPNPLGAPTTFDNTLINAGLAPNPYELDLTKIPGLALGYNPVSKLRDGLNYTQADAAKNERKLIKTIYDTVKLCGGQPSASPKP